jgi:hypothetical protein
MGNPLAFVKPELSSYDWFMCTVCSVHAITPPEFQQFFRHAFFYAAARPLSLQLLTFRTVSALH